MQTDEDGHFVQVPTCGLHRHPLQKGCLARTRSAQDVEVLASFDDGHAVTALASGMAKDALCFAAFVQRTDVKMATSGDLIEQKGIDEDVVQRIFLGFAKDAQAIVLFEQAFSEGISRLATATFFCALLHFLFDEPFGCIDHGGGKGFEEVGNEGGGCVVFLHIVWPRVDFEPRRSHSRMRSILSYTQLGKIKTQSSFVAP